MHTVPQRALDCRPGLGGLNEAYGPNCPTPSRCNGSQAMYSYCQILQRLTETEISLGDTITIGSTY